MALELLESEDSPLSNASAVATDTTITLSGNRQGIYYSDSSCSSSISSIKLHSGTDTHTYYFKDPTSESLSLSATASSGLTPGSLSVTVNPAVASQLAMSGVGTVTAGSCNAITIKSQDSYGNPSNVGGDTTITLSSAGSADTFYTPLVALPLRRRPLFQMAQILKSFILKPL